MIEYAYVNLSGRVSYINDGNFAYRGTWSSGSLYAPPLDVVDYNNGKFIVLIQNADEPPLNSTDWSALVVKGTVNPTDPFSIANTALNTANSALTVAMDAAGTATTAFDMAVSAFMLATAGTNLADEALALISAGTTSGSNIPIPAGTNIVYVSGINLGFTPSSVVATVQMPNLSGENLWPTLVGAPAGTGFTLRLNGTTDQPGYFLHWLARR